MPVCHLWLLPEARAARRLQGLIAWLARRHGTPCFTPHVTLLGRVSGDPRLLRRRLALRAAAWPAIAVTLGPPAIGHSYYQNLMLPVASNPALAALRQRAARLLDAPAGDWFPHLSLAYGIPPRRLPAARRALRVRPLPRRLVLDRLQLVAGGPTPRHWRVLGTWVLAG